VLLTGSASLRALANRNYRRIWLGSLVSNIGTWMETVALGFYVAETTGKAAWTGSMILFAQLPVLLMSPLGGALADRFERRRYVFAVTLFQLAVAATLAALAYVGRLDLWAASILAFLTGSGKALSDPAFSALTADAVSDDELFSARALSSAQFNLGRVVGSGLAAVALGIGGPTCAFAGNALSFAAVLVAVSSIDLVPGKLVPERLMASIRAGVRLSRDDRGIRQLLALGFGTALLISPFISLAPAYAVQVFHVGASAGALLPVAQGVGSLLSALCVGELFERWGAPGLIRRAALAMGVIALAYWLSFWYPLALALMFWMGAGNVALLTPVRTACLARAPRDQQARVASIFNWVFSAGYALGSIGLGALGDRVGLRWAAGAAAATFLAIVSAGRRRGTIRRRARVVTGVARAPDLLRDARHLPAQRRRTRPSTREDTGDPSCPVERTAAPRRGSRHLAAADGATGTRAEPRTTR